MRTIKLCVAISLVCAAFGAACGTSGDAGSTTPSGPDEVGAGADAGRAAVGDASASDATVANDAANDASIDAPAVPATPWPEWAFHHWIWESESTQQSALDIVAGYAAHNIPVGAIIIDSPWETGYNTLEWEPSQFPNPKQMIDTMHQNGVRVLLWIVPAINTDVSLYAQAKQQNFFMEKVPFGGPAVVSWWKGKGSLIDYWNASALAWWQQRVDIALGYGIDGWKCDGLDVSVTSAPFSRGKPGIVTHADYADAYYRHFYEHTRQKLGNDRLITARPVDTYGYDVGLLGQTGVDQATFAPRDFNYVGWVGDQDATFDGMKAALLNMYYSAQQGFMGFGSDIGGYREDKNSPPQMRTKELFVRWAQLGAFSPLMENGGGGEHRPWMFDDETTDIYRTFVKLHYALVPYLMSEGLKAYQQKKSLVTFLDKSDYRYLLGPDVFVAPMIESGTSRSVTFPAGSDWVYLFDKTKTFTAGSSTTLNVPLGDFPVFVRKGSALATQLVVVR